MGKNTRHTYGDIIKIPEKIKTRLAALSFEEKSVNDMIRNLIIDGEICDSPTPSNMVSEKISERFGTTVPVVAINTYMKTFQKEGILIGIKIKQGKAKKRLWLGSWLKTRATHLSIQSTTIPISVNTMASLGSKFVREINDLRMLYGKSGDCTAFLLRKILEKAIFLAFAKNGMLNKLEDPAKKPKYYGLDKMIEIAAAEKGKDGKPYLTPSVAAKLAGVKFLGDSAAHDFLANVEMDEIPHQMPYISVALSELSKKF